MSNVAPETKKRRSLIIDLLLVYVLLAGAYFRFTGLDWGEYQYLHPDERFLEMVGSDIIPLVCEDPAIAVDACPAESRRWMSFSEYFDAAASTLNPVNRGHGFYVYGTLPMFITRFAVQWIYGHSGLNEMNDVGRPLSAAADLLTVVLVYMIATRLYNRRAGILAAAFSAAAVLQIQLSHYFTMDTFLNLFTYLAIYFAVRVAGEPWQTQPVSSGEGDGSGLHVERAVPDVVMPAESQGMSLPMDKLQLSWLAASAKSLTTSRFFLLSIAFGVALGSAVASKLNAAPVAMLLPAAFALTLWKAPAEKRLEQAVKAFIYLCLAAVVSLLVFRLFQPYAFSGPGFYGLKPNELWMANIREQRIQAGGDVDFPPALQWARRTHLFSGKNLVLWGLGLPLGLLAWAGFLWAGWRLLNDRSAEKVEWRQHALLWGWTAFYFIWQSLAFNPTMRYQLPVYPALAIFAGWAVVQLWDKGTKWRASRSEIAPAGVNLYRMVAVLVGGGVLVATYAWAYAFLGIYTRPITRVEASRWIYQNIPGPINLQIENETGSLNQPLPFPPGLVITPVQPYLTVFSPNTEGQLTRVILGHAMDQEGTSDLKLLAIQIDLPGDSDPPVTASLSSEFRIAGDPRGETYTFVLDRPLNLVEDAQYQVTLSLQSGSGAITLAGSAPANESTWDDGLPLRTDGYDGYGGIYQPGLNFEMYWDDNSEKYQRFITTLDQADAIFISSNRQWGTTTRVPERYPLTSLYYRSLLGCPPEREIDWCYSVAQVGKFKGSLGFELAAVFDSSPRLGPLVFNTQFAEEAFTVYDHPKVFIFRKTAAYNPARVLQILGAVDISQAVHVTPKRTESHPANLLLPGDQLALQQAGGSWSELFDTGAITNRFPGLSAVLWYLTLALLGLVAYPLVRLALPGLADGGYPLARAAGMLLLAWMVWFAGSNKIPFSRLTISAALLLIVLAALAAAYWQREELQAELRSRRRYFLMIEGLFLAFFIFDLLIRFGNPDLWHPWKGGEKPMDFAYFNAILKSTTFPPYDPWYAGGYLNYYYYGFVYVGVLVKWLGIVPAVAYNLILPTIFAMIALGAFSIAWNLASAWKHPAIELPDPASGEASAAAIPRFGVGLAGALGAAVLGNLGSVRMIFQGYQRLAAPGGVIEDGGLVQRWLWAAQGLLAVIKGASLPYGVGDWYWIPSRAIPAPNDVEPITEFPFFTVIYGDPHAHLFAIPIALLVLSWGLSVVLSRAWQGQRSPLRMAAGFLLGGLAIGAMYPVNLSDIYTYLPLGLVALTYALLRYYEAGDRRWLPALSPGVRRLLVLLGSLGLLVLLSTLLYKPYSDWYGQGYTKIALWTGTRTPLTSYLVHWGLFLFVILSWMAWETRQWMAETPLSALHRLTPYRSLLYLAGLVLLASIVLTTYLGARIAWFVLPLAAWAGILLLRPGLADTKRYVLFLVGTGLVLTMMVEVVVVVGDIGRMNTVFKFYLQVWTLFAVSAAAALGWLLLEMPKWYGRVRVSWQLVLGVLVLGAALFPLMGGSAKIKDRMTENAPHTLDGMAFMQVAEYAETWGVMDLSQDYRAIRWMQENVTGSPVIVEANLRNLYRWGSRFSIYTGLPGVVGWEWHQQQQRALLPGNWVSERIDEVNNFYTTTDLEQARLFLEKYNVRYIVMGQQERGKYNSVGPDAFVAPEGLAKFEAANGALWKSIYSDADTVIYEVIQR